MYVSHAKVGAITLGQSDKMLQLMCKVLTLHGLLTRHVAHARVRYRCRTAVHTASTFEVQHRHIWSWSLDNFQRQTLQWLFPHLKHVKQAMALSNVVTI